MWAPLCLVVMIQNSGDDDGVDHYVGPLCLVVMIQNSGDDYGVDHDVGHDFEVEDAVATLVMILNSHVDNDETAVIFIYLTTDTVPQVLARNQSGFLLRLMFTTLKGTFD